MSLAARASEHPSRPAAGDGRAFVGDLANAQRARLLNAMVEVASERGAARVSVVHVVKCSGVSRRTFYQIFDDLEDCFAAAFEQAFELAAARVSDAYDPELRWERRVRTGLVALLSFFDEEPRLGSLLVVESPDGGSRVVTLRAQATARLTEALEQGAWLTSARATSVVPALTAEALVGAVLSILRNRLVDPAHEPLVGLASELMSMIVLPYMGPAAARRELARPVPVVARAEAVERARLLPDPFKEAGMRLTYRTMRVLTATAEHPGASNRVIGQTAEISDQGQISKLLGRLERIGMVENTGLGSEKGAPNAWSLTDAGLRVVHSIRAHAEDNHLPDRGN